jgi:hypothetical protein
MVARSSLHQPIEPRQLLRRSVAGQRTIRQPGDRAGSGSEVLSVVIQGAPAFLTVGWIIAVVVLLLCILGVVGVLPLSAAVVFGLIGGLALARLL